MPYKRGKIIKQEEYPPSEKPHQVYSRHGSREKNIYLQKCINNAKSPYYSTTTGEGLNKNISMKMSAKKVPNG